MFFEIIDFEHPAKWFEHEFFFLFYGDRGISGFKYTIYMLR